MAQCELDLLDACALVDEPGSEVVAETVRAYAFGESRCFRARPDYQAAQIYARP